MTGAEEARNGRELAFAFGELALIKQLVEGRELSNDGDRQLCEIWSRLIDLGNRMGSRLASRLNLSSHKERFNNLDNKSKSEIILGIIKIINATSNVVNLFAIGGAKNTGQMKLTYSKLLSDSNVDFYIIDQSVTGMFERRTRIGL